MTQHTAPPPRHPPPRVALATLLLVLGFAANVAGAQAPPPAEAPAEPLTPAEAIELYRELLEVSPDDEANDRVLYQLALAYRQTGAADQALMMLTTLLAEHPRSEFAERGLFLRGEVLFDLERYEEAISEYRMLIDDGRDATLRERALYKTGWSYFKLGEYAETIPSFLDLLDRRTAAAGGASSAAEPAWRSDELLLDAVQVLAIALSYENGLETLEEQVAERVAAPYWWWIYTKLGDELLAKERYSDAARTFEAYVSRWPEDPRAPALAERVIDAYERGGFPSLVIESKARFIERFGPGSAVAGAVAPTTVANDETKQHLYDLGRAYHARGQAGDTAAYATAIEWYRRYLEAFPGDAAAGETAFLLAEALLEQKQFGAAAEAFERAAYDYGAHTRAAEAGYAALVAYQSHEATLAPAEAAAWRARRSESTQRFAATFPSHQQSGAALLALAQEHAAAGERDRAVELATRALEVNPPMAAAGRIAALSLVGDAYFDRAAFADAEQAYRALRALLPAGHADIRAVEDRIASSIYEQAEQQRALGNTAAAEAQFARVRAEVPRSAVAAVADFDRAVLLLDRKDWLAAAAAFEQFRRNYPKHELQADTTRNLALAYREGGQPGNAARELERIAADAPRADANAALWEAAGLYEQAGMADAAAAALDRYLKGEPAFDAAIEGRQRAAELARARGDSAAEDRHLAALIAADAGAGAARTDRSRTLAARASLRLAEDAYAAFMAARLRIPLEASLAAKRTRMERALEQFTSAASYQVAEVTTAATYYIAEIYNELGRALLASDRPPGLSADELEQYAILLEEQAFPFEEQAIEIHETNARRANDAVYDEWVRKSYERLAELVPARYAKAEVSAPFVGSLLR